MKDYPLRQRAIRWGEPFVGYNLEGLHKAWLFYRRAPKGNKTARAYALHALLRLKENAVLVEYPQNQPMRMAL